MFFACTQCHTEFWRPAEDSWKRICLGCWKANKAKERGQSNSRDTHKPAGDGLKLDQEMLRRLIYLCHPDKHNGTQAALLATQFLLKVRDAQTRK